MGGRERDANWQHLNMMMDASQNRRVGPSLVHKERRRVAAQSWLYVRLIVCLCVEAGVT